MPKEASTHLTSFNITYYNINKKLKNSTVPTRTLGESKKIITPRLSKAEKKKENYNTI